jgi:hypothetical protein
VWPVQYAQSVESTELNAGSASSSSLTAKHKANRPAPGWFRHRPMVRVRPQLRVHRQPATQAPAPRCANSSEISSVDHPITPLPLVLYLSQSGGSMRSSKPKPSKSAILPATLPKCPTGIHGLDEITLGGLPRGRPTLVCGGANLSRIGRLVARVGWTILQLVENLRPDWSALRHLNYLCADPIAAATPLSARR